MPLNSFRSELCIVVKPVQNILVQGLERRVGGDKEGAARAGEQGGEVGGGDQLNEARIVGVARDYIKDIPGRWEEHLEKVIE